MNQNIFYIHGANSTSRTWKYITPSLPQHNAYHFEYDTKNGVSAAVDAVVKFMEGQDLEWSIVCHSLGGIIAVLAAEQTTKIKKIASLSTPYGGSKAATVAKFMQPTNLLFKDICPNGKWVSKLTSPLYTLPVPVRAIATYKNSHSVFQEKSDGVVSLVSQQALPGAEVIVMELNHFEVLMSDDVVGYIREFLWQKNH
jgi:pimeloyl-ACP methyl ester carboxylesterase